jgi:hypothetical protein
MCFCIECDGAQIQARSQKYTSIRKKLYIARAFVRTRITHYHRRSDPGAIHELLQNLLGLRADTPCKSEGNPELSEVDGEITAFGPSEKLLVRPDAADLVQLSLELCVKWIREEGPGHSKSPLEMLRAVPSLFARKICRMGMLLSFAADYN